ncbi:ParB N-terminal domain-containing protein [Neomoorella carbonis]|uniref:ParB N-terminal domain-containing protein n=1 Tax=Neomoorella carbonis TaxID=3062783 RepID=UPI00324794AF
MNYQQDFYPVNGVPVVELLLDIENPRIRHAHDQKECLERLLRRRKSFMNLIRDIAENGLSIDPIVISRNEQGKWVVKDGNRRVGALQLLNEPERCPDPILRQEIERLAKDHPENVIAYINCLASDKEEALLRYIDLKHTGANDGIGQESWSAFTKAIFNVTNGLPDQNKRAIQLLLWAEDQGIRIEDDFPITTLTRLLSQRTLELLGFMVEDDQLKLIIDIESARRMIERVINDLANEIIKVHDVFTPKQQIEYANRVRNEILPDGPVVIITQNEQYNEVNDSPNTSPSPQSSANSENEKSQPSKIKSKKSISGTMSQRPRSPKKPSWERECIFPGKSPGFSIPKEYIKAHNIVTELRRLKVTQTPIAVSMLLRALIELSEKHYRELYGLPEKDAFHKRIAAVAEHMASRGEITEEQKEVILRRTRDEKDILHITTLHKYVHSTDFHPSWQILNTLWDEISFFIERCWRI